MSEHAPTPHKAPIIGDVSKKLGPFPIWIWGIAGTGAFLGYQWWTNRTSEPTTNTATTTDPTTGEKTVTQQRGTRRVPRHERNRRRNQHKPPTHKGPIMNPGAAMAENQEVITDPPANNYAQRPPVSSTFGIEHPADADSDAIILQNGQPFRRLNNKSAIGGYDSDVN